MIFRSVFSLMCLILSVLFLLLVQLGCMSPARIYLWQRSIVKRATMTRRLVRITRPFDASQIMPMPTMG